MPTNISVGDEVYVPVERIKCGESVPFALVKGTVTSRQNRTVRVDLPYGIGEVKVASSALHKDVGVCVIRVGDMKTEHTLLDPIGKSVLHFLRLLVPDDQLKYVALRTPEELYAVYEETAPSFTHYVFIGHGSTGELIFSCERREGSEDLSQSLEQKYGSQRVFISLCCHTGEAKFGKSFSKNGCCQALIAPFGPLHGAVASQFLQTFFGYHFLEGKSLKIAFKRARENVPGGAVFRLWKNGVFEGRR